MTDDIRLIDQFIPERYQLELEFNSTELTFNGHVAIHGELTNTTNEITLHSSQLEIDQALVAGDEAKVTTDADNQTVSLNVNNELSGLQQIELTFSGKITQTMHGLYFSDYEGDGESKRIISTQFESHHAREVFPCIDEPAAKAVFELSVISDMPVIGNTPETSLEQLEDGRIQTSFEPTPIMSTYLLALVSGELGQLESKTKRGTIVRALAPPRDVKHLQFAIDTAIGCLEFYEDYFDIEYPLAKCDMVAIPEFAAGAMENWGLITYRETALLVDESNSSLSNRQMVAHVIAHELAHQWFGNLVTMAWWDDLWLNEGFASWIENMVVEHLHPEWDVWTDFVSTDYQSGLSVDSLDSSHPIVQPVHDPREINEIFDTVTYRKGPSIIRMLHDYLGADTFRAGLRQYLTKHAYKNATTEDLWSALSAVTKIDVKEFMSNWTTKRGYPLVTATAESLRQQHFLPHPKKSSSSVVWPVPLNDGQLKFVLDKASAKWPSNELPLTINPNQSSFVRVGYNHAHYQRLAKAIETGQLENAADRVGMLSDVFAIALSGETNTIDGLQLISGIKNERSAHVWETVGAELAGVRTHLLGDEHQHLLAPLVSELIDDQYRRLGWELKPDEPDADRIIRTVVIALALRYELFDAKKRAKSIWQQLADENQQITPDLRGSVYGYVARKSVADYDQLYKLFKNQTLNEEKMRLARAITAIKSTDAANRSLELVKSDEIRQQDVITWLAGLMRNPDTRQTTWDWYQENWDWLFDQFNHGHIFTYLAQILGFFSNDARVEEIRKFFADKDTRGMDLTLEQAIESIETRAAWIKRDTEPTREWLRDNYNS